MEFCIPINCISSILRLCAYKEPPHNTQEVFPDKYRIVRRHIFRFYFPSTANLTPQKALPNPDKCH